MKTTTLLIAMMIAVTASSQVKPYYYQIPEAPAAFTAATVAARMVDGVGFRFFWATEGLTEKDLSFRPSENSRTTMETLEHIHNLANVLLNAVSKKPTSGPASAEKLSLADLRQKTLQKLQMASEILKQPKAKLEDFDIIFESTDSKQEFSFWHLVNGPLSDALYHVGQVVSFRRSSGNPISKGVNFLEGTKTE